MKKEDRIESARNMSILRTLCTKNCSKDECENLRKYYMNQHATYMSSKIISVLLIEFMWILIIMNTGIDSVWANIPYADTFVYGTLWGIGGIYLLQMMIRVVWNTYELKLALDAKNIKKSESDISLRCIENKKKSQLHMYTKINGKNKDLWFYIDNATHRHITFTYNICKSDKSGTPLVVYIVNNRKNDIFVMVKGRKIGDAIDKTLKNTLKDKIAMNKIKIGVMKSNLRRKK